MGQLDRRAHREVERGPSVPSFARGYVAMTERARSQKRMVCVPAPQRGGTHTVKQKGGSLMEAGKGLRKHACLDQHPGMRVHQTDPLNVGTPLEVIRQAFVTPQECF